MMDARVYLEQLTLPRATKICAVGALAIYAATRPTAMGFFVNGLCAAMVALYNANPIGMFSAIPAKTRKASCILFGCIVTALDAWEICPPLTAICIIVAVAVGALMRCNAAAWNADNAILQCPAVDSVLCYMSHGAPERLSDVWQDGGRRRVAAVLRQSIERPTWEAELDSAFRGAYYVGYLDAELKAEEAIADALEEAEQFKAEADAHAAAILQRAERLQVTADEEMSNELEWTRAEVERLKLELELEPREIWRDPWDVVTEQHWTGGEGNSVEELLLKRGYIPIEKAAQYAPAPESPPELAVIPLAEPEQTPEPAQELTGAERTAAILKYKESHSYTQTAEHFGLSVGGVKSLISKYKKVVSA